MLAQAAGPGSGGIDLARDVGEWATEVVEILLRVYNDYAHRFASSIGDGVYFVLYAARDLALSPHLLVVGETFAEVVRVGSLTPVCFFSESAAVCTGRATPKKVARILLRVANALYTVLATLCSAVPDDHRESEWYRRAVEDLGRLASIGATLDHSMFNALAKVLDLASPREYEVALEPSRAEEVYKTLASAGCEMRFDLGGTHLDGTYVDDVEVILGRCTKKHPPSCDLVIRVRVGAAIADVRARYTLGEGRPRLSVSFSLSSGLGDSEPDLETMVFALREWREIAREALEQVRRSPRSRDLAEAWLDILGNAGG